MELSREHFRAMIFYDFRCGLNQQQCVDKLASIFGNEAPSRATVFRWFSEFSNGRTSLQDEVREGRPKSAVVPENIDAVRNLIKHDHNVTYRDIEISLGISNTTINKILHDHLAAKKNSSGWIPQKQELTLAPTNEQHTEIKSKAKTNDEIQKTSTSSAASEKQHNAPSSKVNIETQIETSDLPVVKRSRRKAATEDPLATLPALASPRVAKYEHTITESPKKGTRTRKK